MVEEAAQEHPGISCRIAKPIGEHLTCPQKAQLSSWYLHGFDPLAWGWLFHCQTPGVPHKVGIWTLAHQWNL